MHEPPAATTFTGPIRGVVFDFDGVIVDTEGAVFRAWAEVFEIHDADLPLEFYSRCVGSDHATWDPKKYFEEVTGRQPDWPPILAAKDRRTRDLLEGYGPMEGVLAWLDALREAEIPVAVASSSSREWVGGWLDKLDLAGHFHSYHCRGDVPRVKPAPDLFLRAAAALDLHPQAILAIEDSENGLRAALAAGMAVLAVPNAVTAKQDFRGANRRAASLADPVALDVLATLRAG